MSDRHTASATLAVDAELARDVVDGLGRQPKQLSPKYLYDALGSALFDAICELPWYNVTRGERRLLEQQAVGIMSALGSDATVIELGCGSGEKLAILVAALDGSAQTARVHLVDISPTAIARATDTLARHTPSVAVVSHQAPYEVGIGQALEQRRGGSALILFLGSNIGNLEPEDATRFLQGVRARCRPGDQLLLGVDLVKSETALRLAYDDPLGVTAAFNKNLLTRLNRELDADFDLNRFAHRIVWNVEASRVESYLESLAEQLVCLTGADACVRFEAGERIWTENSYKYEPDGIVELGDRAGFARRAQWVDPDARFALTLFEIGR